MDQPPAPTVSGDLHHVCSLRCSLYALKQSLWAWFGSSDSVLYDFLFTQSFTSLLHLDSTSILERLD